MVEHPKELNADFGEMIKPGERELDYDEYLKVSALLQMQQELSYPPSHDEHLFIVIHQVYELWFKQILHELKKATLYLQEMQTIAFIRSIERVNQIQEILNQQVGILETMTPKDFNEFRNHLNPASGFQSFQFRTIETLLGQRSNFYVEFFKHKPLIQKELLRLYKLPSLYDHFLTHCSKKGLKIPKEVLERDLSVQYTGHQQVQAEILSVYHEPEKHYDLYQAFETLLSFDEKICFWRYRHVLMVQRMIGSMSGTGGSSGSKYLEKTLSKRFFQDLWEIRNQMAKI